jgi:hypothetical protein
VKEANPAAEPYQQQQQQHLQAQQPMGHNRWLWRVAGMARPPAAADLDCSSWAAAGVAQVAHVDPHYSRSEDKPPRPVTFAGRVFRWVGVGGWKGEGRGGGVGGAGCA